MPRILSKLRALRAVNSSATMSAEGGINVGSGQGGIPNFVDLGLPSPHYNKMRKSDFVPYDMRQDTLPFSDESVGRIFCSHVIEHVENEHVERFLRESLRVLTPGGVLRIVTPDAKFLHAVSVFPNRFWSWRTQTLVDKYGVKRPTQTDFLQREVFSAKLFDANRPRNLSGNFEEDMARLSHGSEFDYSHPERHINYWSFQKLLSLAGPGWSQVVESKPGGCLDPVMRTKHFDLTAPHMSMWVDFLK